MDPDVIGIQANIVNEVFEDANFFQRIGEALGIGRLDFLPLPVFFFQAVFKKKLERPFPAADLPFDDGRDHLQAQEFGDCISGQLVLITVWSGMGTAAVDMLENGSLPPRAIIKGNDPGCCSAADLIPVDFDNPRLTKKNLLLFLLPQLSTGQFQTQPTCQAGSNGS